jgi:hypothetical protein
MRRAVRRCPTPRTATTDGSGGTVRGPAAGSAAVRPQRRGGRGGPTPTAPHVRPAGTVSAGVCAPTGQPARPPDTTADASAAAPPLQLAVVRHGSGHRPAMRHGSRTPAVRSAASGPVGVHWQNDQQPCPSRLRQKGRSGCVQAVMEPVGGHLTAAGWHSAWTPRPPAGRSGRTGQDAASSGRSIRCWFRPGSGSLMALGSASAECHLRRGRRLGRAGRGGTRPTLAG